MADKADTKTDSALLTALPIVLWTKSLLFRFGRELMQKNRKEMFSISLLFSTDIAS